MTIEDLAAEILAQLPTSTRAEAESIRAAGERERWASGDQAADLVDELYPRYPKAAIRLAVAILYHCTDSTIRDREWVCRRVPAWLRAQYPDLTYHYWRACAQSSSLLALAGEIMAHKDAYGSMPSVNTVYGWLNPDNRLPAWVLRMGSVLTLLSKIRNDPLLPGEVGAVFDEAMALLGGVSARLGCLDPGVVVPGVSLSIPELDRKYRSHPG